MARISSEKQEIELIGPVGIFPKSDSFQRNRWLYLLWIAATLAAGLLWRSRYLQIPSFLTKYGGDALWALLVFFGFGLLFKRLSTVRLASVALVFAWVIEFSQLYHAPWIDSIRALRIGHLVLGSTFNWPDLAAYALGISIGAVTEVALSKVKIRRNLSGMDKVSHPRPGP